MNDFGQLQLIWIRRLASETSRILTLLELGDLSVVDLVRYKRSISAIDGYCRSVIEAQDWDDVEMLQLTVEDVEEKLFVHFFELIDRFDDDEAHFDFSNDDDGELRLDLDNSPLGSIKLTILDDDDFNIIL